MSKEFASAGLTMGQVNAIVKMLGGEEAARRFLRGELEVREREFKVFMTIKLGTGPKTADEFRQAIKAGGMKIGDWTNDILGKPAFKVATEETEVDLVVISVAELGFKDGARREDVFARAKERGLQLCSTEVGPQLRLQYKNQPEDELLVIGMEPITGSDGYLRLFRVEPDDDGLWLGSYDDCPGLFWDGHHRFVFVRPRK